jgi:hypothetical protein
MITEPLKKDQSYINNLSDLRQEKRRLKARIKAHEEALEQQWKKAPAETFKFIVRKVVPVYLNNKVVDKSWSVASGLFNLIRPGSNKTTARKGMFGAAKKLGLFTAARVAYNLLKKK